MLSPLSRQVASSASSPHLRLIRLLTEGLPNEERGLRLFLEFPEISSIILHAPGVKMLTQGLTLQGRCRRVDWHRTSPDALPSIRDMLKSKSLAVYIRR